MLKMYQGGGLTHYQIFLLWQIFQSDASVKLGDSFLQLKTRMDTKKFHGKYDLFLQKKPFP